MNPLIGVLFHWLGGLAAGSFYVPFRGVKRWSWENAWLVAGVSLGSSRRGPLR
jgi:L-rhamnose-H+ transport protein